MKSPVEQNQLEPSVNIRFFLEPFHKSSLPFYQIVEPFQSVVVRTHVRIIEMREKKIEVSLEHTDNLPKLVVIAVFSSVPLQISHAVQCFFFR